MAGEGIKIGTLIVGILLLVLGFLGYTGYFKTAHVEGGCYYFATNAIEFHYNNIGNRNTVLCVWAWSNITNLIEKEEKCHNLPFDEDNDRIWSFDINSTVLNQYKNQNITIFYNRSYKYQNYHANKVFNGSCLYDNSGYNTMYLVSTE